MRRGQIISINSVSDHCTSFFWKNSSLYQTVRSNDVNVNKKWSQVLYLWITKIKSIRAHNLSLSIKRQVSNNLFIQLQISNPNSTGTATLYKENIPRHVGSTSSTVDSVLKAGEQSKGEDPVQGVHQVG